MKRPISPVSEKSSSVVSSVRLETQSSPRAASTASELGKNGATNTEAEGIDLIDLAYLAGNRQRSDGPLLQIIVPAEMPLLGLGIAPGHEEYGIALLDRIADE